MPGVNPLKAAHHAQQNLYLALVFDRLLTTIDTKRQQFASS